jgi:endonuclease IV
VQYGRRKRAYVRFKGFYQKLKSKLIWIKEVKVQIGDEVILDWCHTIAKGTGFLNSWNVSSVS